VRRSTSTGDLELARRRSGHGVRGTAAQLCGALDAHRAEIAAALGRTDDGPYGIDEVTGEPIAAARREAILTPRTNT
jgi:RNA polymerase-binding transcription factor DksA